MDIIHGATPRVLPRHAQAALADRLRVMPAVIVSGARQTGKSTLAQDLTPGSRRFISLDDLDAMELARSDPRHSSRDRPSRSTRCSGSPTCSGR